MTTTLVPILIAIGVLGLIPLFAVIATSFTLISVILMVVRNAIGIQQMPPNIIIYAIAMVLSLQIMGPTIEATAALVGTGGTAFTSLEDLLATANRAAGPWSDFLRARTTDATRATFESLLTTPANTLSPLQYLAYVLSPAFVAAELTRAFQIGLMIYIPFVAIDLVLSAILVVMGMQTLSPTVISAPLKLLLFVAVEGWTKLFQNMILSYQ